MTRIATTHVKALIGRRIPTRRRVRLLVGACVVLVAAGCWIVAALAGSGTPTDSVSVSTNGLTATLSGNWSWPEMKSPCGPGTSSNRAAGWAVQWGDPVNGNRVLSKGSRPRSEERRVGKEDR